MKMMDTMDLVNQGVMLPLMEEFYTIQGEGYHKGTAAYFIRVGGCDVGCHWCDVKESWDAEKHTPTHIDHIVENAAKYSDTIVVTGGEPLTWDMQPLTGGLKAKHSKHPYRNFWCLPIDRTVGLDLPFSKEAETPCR